MTRKNSASTAGYSRFCARLEAGFFGGGPLVGNHPARKLTTGVAHSGSLRS
jgi:hypothetical protein